MLLIPSSITQLTSEGYHTLQIPTIDINFGVYNAQQLQYVNYPDEYFTFLKFDGSKKRLIFGKENGFLYLSEEGWNFFKNDIQKSFNPNRGSWQNFLNHVDMHFRDVKERTIAYRDKLKQKYQEVDNKINGLGW